MKRQRLRKDFFKERLVETAAAVSMRAAFYGQLGHAVLWVSALNFLACRAGVAIDHQVNTDNARILLKFPQSDSGFGELFQICSTVGADQLTI